MVAFFRAHSLPSVYFSLSDLIHPYSSECLCSHITRHSADGHLGLQLHTFSFPLDTSLGITNLMCHTEFSPKSVLPPVILFSINGPTLLKPETSLSPTYSKYFQFFLKTTYQVHLPLSLSTASAMSRLLLFPSIHLHTVASVNFQNFNWVVFSFP